MVTTSSINLSGSFQSKSEGFIASLANSKSTNKVTDGIVNGAVMRQRSGLISN